MKRLLKSTGLHSSAMPAVIDLLFAVDCKLSEVSAVQPSSGPLHDCRYKKHSSTKLKQHPKLHHSQKGCLSISLAGDEFAFTFLKVLPLDSTHQESLGCALTAPCLSLTLSAPLSALFFLSAHAPCCGPVSKLTVLSLASLLLLHTALSVHLCITSCQLVMM